LSLGADHMQLVEVPLSGGPNNGEDDSAAATTQFSDGGADLGKDSLGRLLGGDEELAALLWPSSSRDGTGDAERCIAWLERAVRRLNISSKPSIRSADY
jgi:hypothetical protein